MTERPEDLAAAKPFDKQAAIVLLSAAVLPTLWRLYGSPASFDEHLAQLYPNAGLAEMYRVLYSFVAMFVLGFVLPALTVTLVFRKKLRDFGLRLGDIKTGLIALAVLLPPAALLLIPTAGQPAFRAEYPLYHRAGELASRLVLYELCYAVYYFGWEFFYRGYMLFGLRDSVGAANAVLIQTIPSALVHIGKPNGEILAAIVAGIAFGAVALRTRSILYVFVLHWLVGVGLDLLIVLGPA